MCCVLFVAGAAGVRRQMLPGNYCAQASFGVLVMLVEGAVGARRGVRMWCDGGRRLVAGLLGLPLGECGQIWNVRVRSRGWRSGLGSNLNRGTRSPKLEFKAGLVF